MNKKHSEYCYVIGGLMGDEPLEYGDAYQDGYDILVVGDFATIFPTTKEAKKAIKDTKAYGKRHGYSTKKDDVWGCHKIVYLHPRCPCGDEASIHNCDDCSR